MGTLNQKDHFNSQQREDFEAFAGRVKVPNSTSDVPRTAEGMLQGNTTSHARLGVKVRKKLLVMVGCSTPSNHVCALAG